MKTHIHDMIMRAQASRRGVLKGAGALAATTALSGLPGVARADGHSVREEILKIPGVGAGSPTDSDWQKVGELCLGATKERVQPGEFEGVDFPEFERKVLDNGLTVIVANRPAVPIVKMSMMIGPPITELGAILHRQATVVERIVADVRSLLAAHQLGQVLSDGIEVPPPAPLAE